MNSEKISPTKNFRLKHLKTLLKLRNDDLVVLMASRFKCLITILFYLIYCTLLKSCDRFLSCGPRIQPIFKRFNLFSWFRIFSTKIRNRYIKIWIRESWIHRKSGFVSPNLKDSICGFVSEIVFFKSAQFVWLVGICPRIPQPCLMPISIAFFRIFNFAIFISGNDRGSRSWWRRRSQSRGISSDHEKN
jgi:hypothetical protein